MYRPPIGRRGYCVCCCWLAVHYFVTEGSLPNDEKYHDKGNCPLAVRYLVLDIYSDEFSSTRTVSSLLYALGWHINDTLAVSQTDFTFAFLETVLEEQACHYK